MICWLKQTRWTLIGIVLAGLVTDARALDPNRLPSQYVREQWTTETRFPGGAVNGIAQTADGYLWIGTDRGLIRFDGFNFRPVSLTSIADRFERFDIATAYGCWRKTVDPSTGRRSRTPKRWQV